MSAISAKISGDIEFYAALYDQYKRTPALKNSAALAQTMRDVITGLKKLKRMH
jgi:hypothetical protein